MTLLTDVSNINAQKTVAFPILALIVQTKVGWMPDVLVFSTLLFPNIKVITDTFRGEENQQTRAFYYFNATFGRRRGLRGVIAQRSQLTHIIKIVPEIMSQHFAFDTYSHI